MIRALPLLGVLAGALAPPAAAQAPGDTVVVVPGARYRAGPLERALLGSSYRDLWTSPVRVPVLDLGTFAGGLEPTEQGGGNQTLSLRFRGADGREYAFRSVDKFPGRQGHARGPAAHVVQDQVSSLVPAAALVAARLAGALGILHVGPALYVMPDDPRLGEFRARFAGMLGQIEERPREGFAGADESEDTDDFLERIDAEPLPVDARGYLVSRLLDLVLGDWDRHGGQYRWKRMDDGVWRGVALDRDYAFVDYDGLLPDLGRPYLVKLVRYGPRVENLYGLMEQAQELDRRLLGELERSAWDSAAAFVRTRLTDPVIDDAILRMPPEHRALRGAQLAALLRARRDDLPRTAARFYRMTAREAEAHGTGLDELATVEHFPGGVEVRIARPGARPHFRRRYLAEETREVRVFLRGGDDRATVTGAGPVLVRIVGGEGDDLLEDRGAGRTAFYDEDGENRFLRGARTVVDARSWEEPEPAEPGAIGGGPHRDWGTRWTTLALGAEVRPYAGLVLSAGPRRVRYGFRRHPAAVDGWVRALWSPAEGRVGVEARHRRRWTASEGYGWLFGRASELEAVSFAGFGNDVAAERAVAWERQLLGEAGVSVPVGEGIALRAAAVGRWTDPERTAAVRGLDRAWWAGGARGGIVADRRGADPLPRRGWTVDAGGRVFPVSTAGEGGAFGRGTAVGTAYLALGRPVLALRAGGEAAWGAFPVQEAAFIGGSPRLRGYRHQRFVGDRAAFGSAELRVPVGSGAGVFALADAGRVWHAGRSAGGWHTALGGGAWVRAVGHTLTATFAYGEEPVLYLGLSLPY